MTGKRPQGIDEATVVRLWEEQAFPPAALGDLGLTVIFRGVPSDAGGPDYQDALLRAPGGVIGGDIEFHVDSAEWRTHHHDRNPAYNGVILHVVWTHSGGQTVTADGTAIPVVALSRYLPGFQGPARQTSLLDESCERAVVGVSAFEVEARVRTAGLIRFRERADRFATEIDATSPNDALYVALFESLGYASNREVFRRLAECVPFAWLMNVPAAHRAEVLLDAAGLGPPAAVRPPARLPADAWRLERLRPANHPARRLNGIAGVITRLAPDPTDAVLSAICSDAKPGDLRSLFTAAGDVPFIGSGRADEMVVSVLLPFVSGAGEADAAKEWFLLYPSPPANRWTRLMVRRIESQGIEFRVRTAAHHQGLHHIYHAHCRLQRPAGCPLCHGA